MPYPDGLWSTGKKDKNINFSVRRLTENTLATKLDRCWNVIYENIEHGLSVDDY